MIPQELIDFAKAIMAKVEIISTGIKTDELQVSRITLHDRGTVDFVNSDFMCRAIYGPELENNLAIYYDVEEKWVIPSKVETIIEAISVSATNGGIANVIVHSNGANGTILSGSVVMPASTAVEITISGISDAGMSLYDVCPLFAMSDLATPTLKVQFPTFYDDNAITFGFASGLARTVAFSWIAGTLSCETE